MEDRQSVVNKGKLSNTRRTTAMAGMKDIDFERLFHVLPGAYILMAADDPDFTILSENQAHADIAMSDPAVAIGKKLLDQFPDTSDKYTATGESDLVNSLRKVIATGKPDTMEAFRYDVPRPNGSFEERYWRVTHYPVFDKQNQVVAVYQATTNITAERQLLQTERQLDEALSIGRVGSWVWDVPKNKVVADKNLAKLFGVSYEQAAKGLPLTTFTNSIHPDDRERVMNGINVALTKKKPYEEEYRVISTDGTVSWVIARGSIEYDGSGAPLSFSGVLVDVTDRKQIELNLQFIAQASAMLASSLDYKKMLRRVATICVPDLADWCAIDMIDEQGNLSQLAVAHKDPAKVAWAKAERAKRPPKLDDPAGVPNVVRTGKAEFYPTITDSMLTASAKTKADLQRARRLMFRSVMIVPLKLQDKTIGAITFVASDNGRHYTPSDFEAVQEVAARASLAITNANLYQSARQELAERERLEEELRHVNEELEQRVSKRTAQLQTANEGLQRSNQELQDFAYVASHDLQEPLRKIQAFSNLLSAEYAANLGDGKDYLDRMKNAAARMSTLIEDLLSFSRVTTMAKPFEPVKLSRIVRDVLGDLEARIEETGGDITVGKLPTIMADPLQMRQLFQNLIGNALKFSRPGTPPVVTITATKALANNGTLASYVLHVADNGIGFDEKYLDRIFAVFQRLHGRTAYQGTGIGLAICRKIAERHGGSITARSTPNKGAEFIVTLPLKPKGEIQ